MTVMFCCHEMMSRVTVPGGELWNIVGSQREVWILVFLTLSVYVATLPLAVNSKLMCFACAHQNRPPEIQYVRKYGLLPDQCRLADFCVSCVEINQECCPRHLESDANCSTRVSQIAHLETAARCGWIQPLECHAGSIHRLMSHVDFGSHLEGTT